MHVNNGLKFPPPGSIHNTIDILIVEDDAAVADYLKETLSGTREPAFSCLVAENLSAGLALLSKKRFGAVLLDLGLPDSQGMETAVAVRQRVPDVPIVVLTGLADEEIAVQALRIDIQDYVLKRQMSGELLVRSIRYAIERKRAHEALRESEEKFRAFFESVAVGTAQLDPRSGRFVEVNDRFCQMSGYGCIDLLAMTPDEITHHDDRVRSRELFEGLISGRFNEYNVEKRCLRKDGSTVWVQVAVTLIRDSAGRPARTLEIIQDITGRKQAEEALRESEERLRLAAQAANFGTYDIDIENRETFWSTELKGLFGLPDGGPSRVPSGEGLKFVHPDDRERINQVISASRDPAGSGRFNVEHRVIRADGSVIWVNMRGRTFFEGEGAHRRPVRIAGVLMDITERRRAEEELRKSEERLRMVVEAARALVYEVDVRDNRIVVLRGLKEVFGYEPSEIAYSRDWWNTSLHPDDRAFIDAHVNETKKTGRDYSVEYRVRHKRGDYITVQDTGKTIRDSAGRVTGFVGGVVDITGRRRAEEELRISEERFRTLADNIPQLAWMADEKGWVFWYNKRWFEYTGASDEEMRGWSSRNVQHPDHVDRVVKSFMAAFKKGEAWEETFPLRGRDGAYRWFLCRAIPIRGGEGKVVRWFGTNTDITDRMRMEEEIKHIAQHDPLTGLPNRRLLNEIITMEMAQARRSGRRVALFFLDLDRFKEINDTLGHETGDGLLKETAARLRAVIRTSDTVARIGGDEFNVLIPDISHPEYASEVAEKILNEIRKPFRINGHELNVSTSIGISVFPDDGADIDTLLRYADIAMYYAKEHGRNMHQFYNPVINTRSLERMRFETSLRRAIDQNEFRLYFQPLVDVATGKIVSAEVLLRWQHPEKGLLRPAQFFGAAEEIGFMPQIDDWVLKSVCSRIRSWVDEGDLPVCVTVNVSARQFQSPDLLERMAGMLRESGTPADCLDIEIAETAAMGNIENTIARLKELTRIGVNVSIDNFGMGYSPLNLLRRLPIRKVKIDRSFIRDIPTDSEDRAIISAVLMMAHSMNMKVVATGVEVNNQLTFLKEAHCDQAQGFLFSEPVPADKFGEMVKQR